MNPLDRLFALEHHGIKLGLENIQSLLDALGRPHEAWSSVHIAGTNGKGSVTAMVERGLRAAGHRTGRYTSPHLARIEERVAIDGVPVEHAMFVGVTAELLAVIDELLRSQRLAVTPTFFETTTAIAFEIFRKLEIDVGVIEVGLGGRFDATNVITPRVTAITSIAHDHEKYLGSTIPEIAFEKAGIIKPGVPVVVGNVPPDARAVIERVCQERDAPLIDTRTGDVQSATRRGRSIISLKTNRHTFNDLQLALSGRHQIDNAVTAIHVLEASDTAGLRVDRDSIVTAVEKAVWPARLEWIRFDGRRVLFDAAHNPAGAQALAAYLGDLGSAHMTIVMAIMRDKDVRGIVTPLVPFASMFVTTETGAARSMPAGQLAELIGSIAPATRVMSESNAIAALRSALSHGMEVAVAGSIFLVGPLRDWLLSRGAVPEVESS